MKPIKRHIVTLFIACVSVSLFAADKAITIPLRMSVFHYAPLDSPIGSTPDPTDPNQFRASLVGNTLRIETQAGLISYVVITERQSEWKNEDYFYGLSDGVITCPVTRTGFYTICIGCWNIDFVGQIEINSMSVWDLSGQLIQSHTIDLSLLPENDYVIRANTSLGGTSTKIHVLP